jgi:hypothetical protein
MSISVAFFLVGLPNSAIICILYIQKMWMIALLAWRRAGDFLQSDRAKTYFSTIPPENCEPQDPLIVKNGVIETPCKA